MNVLFSIPNAGVSQRQRQRQGVRREPRQPGSAHDSLWLLPPPPWASLEKETQTADRQLGQNLIASLSLKNIKLHK